MPVVGFNELRKHASDFQYRLTLVDVITLPIVKGVIKSSAELDAPVVLAVDGNTLKAGLLPSLEAMARQAPSPVSLLANHIQNADQAVLAVRLGCNALVLADGLTDPVMNEIRSIAESCGIPVLEQQALSESQLDIDQELESATLAVIGQAPSSWQEIDASVTQAAASHMHAVFDKSGAKGQGRALLESCKPWRPVEHLIVYNTLTDEAASEEMAAEGRRVLDKLPGVRATWSGRALTPDAGYRWCWLIRFAHPAVIDSYREHPDHVAYADNHFRPAAGDRISIDYELTGADEP